MDTRSKSQGCQWVVLFLHDIHLCEAGKRDITPIGLSGLSQFPAFPFLQDCSEFLGVSTIQPAKLVKRNLRDICVGQKCPARDGACHIHPGRPTHSPHSCWLSQSWARVQSALRPTGTGVRPHRGTPSAPALSSSLCRCTARSHRRHCSRQGVTERPPPPGGGVSWAGWKMAARCWLAVAGWLAGWVPSALSDPLDPPG